MTKTSSTLIFKKDPIISLQGQPSLLYTATHLTLLAALESKQVAIFAECRSGYCGACKTTIISGSVEYLSPPLAQLQPNECLPCCCRPVTNLNLDLSAQGVSVIRKAYYPNLDLVEADMAK
ncbi:class I ribonucleotide reductase maintenance protein YfaE [Shewanella sp. NIFS-20-20]|uniref:class I ribonucleotide reductase maintenance protein YfaE n=1 Tax=Shewanella sp. NIFS-20-20 TaxID=2853806 RepID=UPI001C446942|nr:class I ribonucleotide reductase maintenance protein YfaE [Shewanella sp. NIFS-20-20]MBV7315229.1 2Fe-2S ferredoxin-like protein [Shewanella sp. NIFS-20-20]